MASWRELPEDLAPEGRRLIIRMRQLKDRSGLSLTALGRRTSYSSSSWARYLNGQSRPPARAVQELAHECDEDPHRLLAMLSLAEESWPGAGPPGAEADPSGAREQPGAAGAPDRDTLSYDTDVPPYVPPENLPPEPLPPGSGQDLASPSIAAEMPQQLVQDRDPAGGTPPPRRTGRLVALAAVGAVAGAALTVGALTLGGDLFRGDDPVTAHESETDATSATDDGLGDFPEAGGELFDCEVTENDGLLGAGYSSSQDVVLQNGMAGWDVVETQCLLEHQGISPGDVDGWYGPDTERAVQRFQERHDLVVDGMVGPHTWGELRR